MKARCATACLATIWDLSHYRSQIKPTNALAPVRDSASGHHFYSDRGVHPLMARCEAFVLQAALQVFLDSHVPTRDSHHGVGMEADDSFEKALSTLFESTDVAT